MICTRNAFFDQGLLEIFGAGMKKSHLSFNDVEIIFQLRLLL
jgi:hypothetical protein